MKVRDPGDKLLQQKEDSPYLFCSPFTGQIPVWSFKMIVIPFDPGIPLQVLLVCMYIDTVSCKSV